MKKLRWLTESGVPTLGLGNGDARLFLEKGGCHKLFVFVVELLHGGGWQMY